MQIDAGMDDTTLVIECVKGNVRAQQKLFDKFARKMLGVCLRYAKDSEQADDILQDGFDQVEFSSVVKEFYSDNRSQFCLKTYNLEKSEKHNLPNQLSYIIQSNK